MEGFIEEIKKGIQARYEESDINLAKVTKNNGVLLTGLTVHKKGSNISPTVYLEGYYEEYKAGKLLEDIIDEIGDIYEQNPGSQIQFDVKDFQDFQHQKAKICFKVINKEANRELLKDVPYVEIAGTGDLVKVYYINIDQKEGMATILIHNAHMKMWNCSVEELDSISLKNTPTLLSPMLESMAEILKAMLPEFDEQIDIGRKNMIVCSNIKKQFGASVMFYPGMAEKIFNSYGKCFALPSSIHEWILLPVSDEQPEELNEMVREVNATQLAPDEILSDHAYFLDAEGIRASA